MWHSKESTAWTVVFEADARFQISCLNRFIYVKPVKDLTELLQHAEVVRGKVSTVGIAAAEPQAEELAGQLARWGATRVCPLGQMQNPPLTGGTTAGRRWAIWSLGRIGKVIIVSSSVVSGPLVCAAETAAAQLPTVNY